MPQPVSSLILSSHHPIISLICRSSNNNDRPRQPVRLHSRPRLRPGPPHLHPAYPPPTTGPIPILVADTPVPNTPLAQRINAYAKAHLPAPTYNHSLRIYHFGLAIKRHRFPFPDWDFSDGTYFLSCALHDIGTTEENIQNTRLSFEWVGGYLALDLLQEKQSDGDAAPRAQAESVAEVIIRHQDLCTPYRWQDYCDNTGAYADLVHPETIKDASEHFPRLKWSNCFTDMIHRENGLKPWAHTTALGEEEFPAKVLANTLMR
ncbi:urea hydro-lyase/cyanamide hydratase, partial [Penicillium daleae]